MSLNENSHVVLAKAVCLDVLKALFFGDVRGIYNWNLIAL